MNQSFAGAAFRVAAAALLAVPALSGPPQAREKPSTETGYVVSYRPGRVLSLSNIPLGEAPKNTFSVQPQGSAAGGASPPAEGNTRRVFVRSTDGKTRQLTPEEVAEREKEKKDAPSGETGKKKIVVRSSDGKTREISGEELERILKQSKQSGDASSDSSQKADTPAEPKRVQFFRFDVASDVVVRGEIVRGTRVKVTFRTEGEKKVATRIEVVDN